MSVHWVTAAFLLGVVCSVLASKGVDKLIWDPRASMSNPEARKILLEDISIDNN